MASCFLGVEYWSARQPQKSNASKREVCCHVPDDEHVVDRKNASTPKERITGMRSTPRTTSGLPNRQSDRTMTGFGVVRPPQRPECLPRNCDLEPPRRVPERQSGRL